MYKVTTIEDNINQNTVTISDTASLFQYVQKLVVGYNAFDWNYVCMELAVFVEFSSQCCIDIGYTTRIKIEEC